MRMDSVARRGIWMGFIGSGPLTRKLEGRRGTCTRKRRATTGLRQWRAQSEGFEKTTVGWVREVVVGLHLCPFAEGVMRSGRLRVVVSTEGTAGGVRERVMREIKHLMDVSAEEVQTTLIVAAEYGREDFLEFQEFCSRLEEEVEGDEGLVDEVAVAWFHPEFRWGDAGIDEAVHYDKRAPYPTINLLRADELDGYIRQGRTQGIVEGNRRTLERVGVEHMQGLYRRVVRGGGGGDE